MPVVRRIQLGGLAAMVGGLLWMVKAAIDIFDTLPYRLDLSDDLLFLALLLITGAPVGVSALLARRCRRLQVAGVALAAAGGLLAAGGAFATWNLRASGDGPFGPWTMLYLGMLGLYLGTLLLGIATLKTRALRRWSVLPLTVALLPLLLSVPVPLGWLGLFSETVGHPSFEFSRVLGKVLLLLIGLSWVTSGYVVWSAGGSAGRAVGTDERSHRLSEH